MKKGDIYVKENNYCSSSIKKGISKKSKQPYAFLNIMLSDGYNDAECVDWKKTKPLRFRENSLVFVRGTLKKGFRTNLSINLREIENIE